MSTEQAVKQLFAGILLVILCALCSCAHHAVDDGRHVVSADYASRMQGERSSKEFARRIYIKLPLLQPRFHWVFLEKKSFLSGSLVLTISAKGKQTRMTIFEDGALSDEWEIMDADKHSGDRLYFGFESKERVTVSEADQVHLHLTVKEDIRGQGEGAAGVLRSGSYESTSQFTLYHLESFSGKKDVYAFLNNDAWRVRWRLEDVTGEWRFKEMPPTEPVKVFEEDPETKKLRERLEELKREMERYREEHRIRQLEIERVLERGCSGG